jgi:hypothetical protein
MSYHVTSQPRPTCALHVAIERCNVERAVRGFRLFLLPTPSRQVSAVAVHKANLRTPPMMQEIQLTDEFEIGYSDNDTRLQPLGSRKGTESMLSPLCASYVHLLFFLLIFIAPLHFRLFKGLAAGGIKHH